MTGSEHSKCKVSVLAAKVKRETGLVAAVLVPTGKAGWLSRRSMVFLDMGSESNVACGPPEGGLVSERTAGRRR